MSDEPLQQVWDVSDHEDLRLVEECEVRFSGYHHRVVGLKVGNAFRFPMGWLDE